MLINLMFAQQTVCTGLHLQRSFPAMTDAERDRLYQEVGRRVRARRKVKGLSQENLGAEVGISRASIVNLEKGRQRPPLHVLWEIAERLSVDPSELIPTRAEFHLGSEAISMSPELAAHLKKMGVDDPRVLRSVASLAKSSRHSS